MFLIIFFFQYAEVCSFETELLKPSKYLVLDPWKDFQIHLDNWELYILVLKNPTRLNTILKYSILLKVYPWFSLWFRSIYFYFVPLAIDVEYYQEGYVKESFKM